jgi:S1-C subfamily serine protease
LSNGQQVEFKVLKEVDGKDLVFLVTKTPILGSAVPFRENASLEEGEELVCRASVAQGPLCTVRGSLAYAPRPSTSGVLVAQLPLSPGSSGTGLFDLQGRFVGVCIGPVSDKESNFIRAWSADVIHDAIKSSFPEPWKDYLPELGLESLTITQYSGKLDLQSGDKIDTVNGIPMHSQSEFILTCAAFTARRETRIELGIDRNGNKAQILIERP